MWLLYLSMVNVNWGSPWFDEALRPNRPAPLSVLSFPLIFYVNAFYLLPQFLSKRKWAIYLLALVLFLCLIEGFRLAITFLALQPDQAFLIYLQNELFSQDSLIFSTPSPAWLGLLISFFYRFTKDWFINKNRIERLENQKNRMMLHQYRAQMNPHFLFNNLNTLDGLMDTHPKKARDYLHQLAALYRYLVIHAEEDLVTLEAEWAFIKNYIYLIEIRFGGAYLFDLEPATDDPKGWLIPPASLQMVLENVVKHNSANKEKPLQTYIKIADGYLKVSHTKQPKITEEKNDTGTGLALLSKRFEAFTNRKIVVEEAALFTVSLPILKACK